MKSAYERALERLKQQGLGDAPPLTDAQRKKLRELESEHEAKVAEREIVVKQKIAEVVAAGDLAKAQELHEQLLEERRSLREKLEREKQRVLQPASRRKRK